MLEAFAFAATLSCSLFCGAALYINFVEHPARMECGTELAATVFGPSYKRAAIMQATLALLATGSALPCWLLGGSILWMVGAVLIFLVIPFTLVVVFPTNKQLLSPALDRRSAHAHELLTRWGRLHAIRSVFSLMATLVFLMAMLNW